MFFKSYQIVLLALAITLFPRIVTTMGAPKILNFLHFAYVPVIFGLAYPKMQPYRLKLFWITLALFGVITLSAFIGGAGPINVVLDFLLLAEPFLLLLLIVGLPWSSASVKRFRFWLLLFAFVNVGMAYFQHFVRSLNTDDVKGIFIDMGAGHHIAGAVALSAAVYFLIDFPPVQPRWLRIALGAAVAIFFAPVVIYTDAKQVILVFLLSLPILMLLNLRNLSGLVKNLGYVAVALIGIGIVIELADTVFPALKTWTDIGQISEGLALKFSIFSLMAEYYTSPLNWLVGLGPGHTVGRLGQLLPEYSDYLRPLGASFSPVTEAAKEAEQGNWITNSQTGSSLWSSRFTWAGVWGDLGLLGLATYLYLWFVALRQFCLDDLSRFLLITVLVFGVVFAWMEEPGYVLFIAALIGLRWQELRSRERIIRQKRLRKFALVRTPYSVDVARSQVTSE